MSNERQRHEQEALDALNRGSTEGALKAYLSILRLDPKDRRVRQKVGEIYLRTGKTQDAERHLREVADSFLKEGSHRAAASVLKQLVSIRPDEPELQLDLGECYLQGAYQTDAKGCFDAALRGWTALGKPLLAAKAARRLAEVTPADLTLRLKVGELLEAGGDIAGAGKSYQEVIEEFRRRGRTDEVGRIAEMALKSRPDDVGLLLDTAAAKILQGEHKKALQSLQTAFLAGPKEPRTLDLLARAFEGAGQPDRALKVLLELARVASDRNDLPAEADALRRASALAPDDEDVQARKSRAEDRLGRLERKLTTLAFLEPTTEEVMRVAVRAEVFVRFGLFDRAEIELKAALASRGDSLPLGAAMAELLVANGRVDEAIGWMERLLPHAGDERAMVLDRMALLRGVDVASSPEAVIDDEELVDDPTVPPLTPTLVAATPTTPAPAFTGPETAETRGDRLSAAGDLAGALMAWREALAEDPLNEGVLTKIAALRSAARSAPPPPAPEPTFGHDDGTFAEVEPDALDETEAPNLDEARALVAVGEADAALALAQGAEGLEARVIESQAYKVKNDVGRALEVLREATNDASENDPAYAEALFELAGLYTATQKHRSALRLLEELRDLAPDYRRVDVEARLRGLQMIAR